MPLYEFRCLKCGAEFEQIVFSTDRDPIKCPKCESTDTERLLSIFSSGSAAGELGASAASSCGTSAGGFS
ncbi:MAG: zinc ribbon domain-containing protein [Deltaproteobacteria bacterium]|nr:zinc ribbon domain-containing protein [Deltaproteobacteria bacterium]